MASIRALTHVEHAWETVFGQAVATPTVRLALVKASPEFTPVNDVTLLDEERGAGGRYTAVQEGIEAAAKIPMFASYEHVHYPLEWCFGTVSPSGTTAPYTRDYAGFLATQLTPRGGTLQFGNGVGVYEMISAAADKLTFTQAKRAGPLEVEASLKGHSIVSGAFKAGPVLADVAVSPILGAHATVYLDAAGGTMGSTALAATVGSFSLEIDPGLNWADYVGSLYHGGVYQSNWKVSLKLSCEFNAGMKTYADAWVAATWQKLVRIRYTTGAAAALKLFQVDFAGTMLTAPKLFSDQNDRLMLDVELEDTYDAVFAHYLKIQTRCATATLT